MCSTVYLAQCVCGTTFFYSQLTFSDSKDNIIWPQMSPLTSANEHPQHNTDANWSYRRDDSQWMAQPIASGVRVYTARPSLSLSLPPSLPISLSLSATMASLHTDYPGPKPFWPHHSPSLHLNLPSHSHFLFNTCSSVHFPPFVHLVMSAACVE